MVIELSTRRRTIHFARAVASILQRGDLVLLEGPLGAGKTFFTRALLRACGLDAREPVRSPTFALVHQFDSPRGPLVHADLYRLRGADSSPPASGDVERLGLADARRRGEIVIVEWGMGCEIALGGAPELVVRLAHAPRGRTATVIGRSIPGFS